MRVKAAVAHTRHAPLTLEGLDLDEPRDDEVLVKLIASGVARADVEAIDGRLAMPLPFVPGCEGAGIVERIGPDVTHLAPGDSVVVTFAFCGHCEPCATGQPRHCADFGALNLSGRRLDGSAPFSNDGQPVNGSFFGQSSFATHLICRTASAIKVPTGAPLEVLACLGGALLLGAGAVLHGFDLQAEETLLVTGADAVGLVAVMAAKARGAKLIIVADADERRRDLASELGATVALHTGDNLVNLVKSLAADGVGYALETTGAPSARAACLASLARGGTCALVDAPADAIVDFEDQIAEDKLLVLSADAHSPPHLLIPELADLHARKLLPLEKIIDFFPFEHINDALDGVRDGAVVKPVVRFALGAFGDLDRAGAEGVADEAPEDVPDDVPEPETAKAPAALVKS